MLTEPWATFLRTIWVGALAYASLVILLRISGKRTLSKWNAFDLVISVAFGSTLATVLLSRDNSLAQGVVAFALLILLQFAITWLSVRSRRMRRWIKSEPRVVLFGGEFQHDALRAERVTEGEVRATLRAHGVSAVGAVYAVVLETDGSFSVIENPGPDTSALADVTGIPED